MKEITIKVKSQLNKKAPLKICVSTPGYDKCLTGDTNGECTLNAILETFTEAIKLAEAE